MSSTERRHFQIEETKRRCCAVYGSGCYIDGCGLIATQLGHILPQDDNHIKRYGKALIHHWSNQRPVCGLEHNRQVQINYRGHPMAAEEQAKKIRAMIEEEIEWSR